MPPRSFLMLSGFLPGSCRDDGEFHGVEVPEGQRLKSLAGGGFGWALAIGDDGKEEDDDKDDRRKKRNLHCWGRPPFSSSSPASDEVLLAAAGYDHAVVSKPDGSLWFCGWGAGVFGSGGGGGARGGAKRMAKENNDARNSSSLPPPPPYLSRWTRLPLPPSSSSPPVSALACGFDRTLALLSTPAAPAAAAEEEEEEEEGEGNSSTLWEWGGEGGGASEEEEEEEEEQRNGKEGSSSPSPSLPLPRLVPFPRGTRITAVSAGAHHCAAVDSEGALWTWGENLRGQCGLVVGSDSSSSSKREKNFPSSSSSSSFSLCVPAPTKNPALGGVRVLAVAAGGSHTLVLCDSGSLYGFGDNEAGQLGYLVDEEEGGGEEEEDDDDGEKVVEGEEEKKRSPLLSSTRVPMPVAVVIERGSDGSSPPSFASISAGATHSLALAEAEGGGGKEVYVLGRVSPSSSSPSPSPSDGGGGSSLSPFCPPRRAVLPLPAGAKKAATRAKAMATAVESGWWHAMVLVAIDEEAEVQGSEAPEEEGRAAKRTKKL